MTAELARQDDEINLKDLLQTLWRGKWLIALLTLLFAAAAVTYSVLAPNKLVVSLPVNHISSIDALQYRNLNTTDVLTINAGQLHNRFVETFNLREDARAVITERFPVDQKRDTEWQMDVAYDFIIRNINERSKEDLPAEWMLEYTGYELPDFDLVLEEVLERVEDRTFDRLNTEFTTLLSQQILARDNNVEDLEANIENAKFGYEKSTTTRLAFLKEQAAIARELNIRTNTLSSQTIAAANGLVTNVEASSPYYSRGYVSIEREIALIEARQDPELHTPGIVDLQKQIDAIDRSKRLSRAKQYFAESPLANRADFSPVYIDMNTLEVEKKRSTVMMGILFAIMGGFLAILIVLIREAMSSE